LPWRFNREFSLPFVEGGALVVFHCGTGFRTWLMEDGREYGEYVLAARASYLHSLRFDRRIIDAIFGATAVTLDYHVNSSCYSWVITSPY
jgi:hypothetical protein